MFVNRSKEVSNGNIRYIKFTCSFIEYSIPLLFYVTVQLYRNIIVSCRTYNVNKCRKLLYLYELLLEQLTKSNSRQTLKVTNNS